VFVDRIKGVRFLGGGGGFWGGDRDMKGYIEGRNKR
jgi:hypothetical protein